MHACHCRVKRSLWQQSDCFLTSNQLQTNFQLQTKPAGADLLPPDLCCSPSVVVIHSGVRVCNPHHTQVVGGVGALVCFLSVWTTLFL